MTVNNRYHRILFSSCITALISFAAYAQEISSLNFRSPLDIPLQISGNFGEIRSNHFHSGLDFKTNGQSGLPVYAAERGYISRIKVDPEGYGKALYISHPNGYTTLYGHLSRFTKNIDQYVLSAQYKRESFAVDLYLKPGQFTVNQGDYIALSGSTGSSEAPHLHFEIRDSQTQNPVNPMLYHFKINDTKPPVIKSLYLYSLTGRKDIKEPLQIPLIGRKGKYMPKSNRIFPLDNIAGVGIEAVDYLDDSNNKCGIYELMVFLDDNIIFSSKIDEFSFAETMYINSLIDFRLYKEDKKQVIKAFIQPNNHLSIYQYVYNRGQIQIRDTLVHKLTIRVNDTYNNVSETTISVRKNPGEYKNYTIALPYYSAFFNYSEPNHYEQEGIKLDFKSNSFYDNIYFSYHADSIVEHAYARVHHIHTPSVPVQRSFTLAIKPDSLPADLKKYALIVRINDSGQYIASGGKWQADYLVTKTRSFGNYTITIDSIPPLIEYRGKSRSDMLIAGKNIIFSVRDNLSGIASYRGTINGKWVLFEWDPKTATLKHNTDRDIFTKDTDNILSLRVTDNLGNTTIYTKLIAH